MKTWNNRRTSRSLVLCVLAGLAAPAMWPSGALANGSGVESGGVSAKAQRTTPATAEELRPFVDRARQHLGFLSSNYMDGRAPGTEGNRIAAKYIESNLRALGMKPAFPSDVAQPDGTTVSTPFTSFRQAFVAPASSHPPAAMSLSTQTLALGDGSGADTFTPGTDFNVIGMSGSGAVTGNVVFVGYSVERDVDVHEGGYDSYPEGTDLSGKIALVYRFEPMNAEGKSLWTKGQGWSPAAALDGKLRRAADAGASAIILVNPPGADDPRASRLEDMFSMPGGRTLKIPVVMMSPQAAERLVRAGDEQGRGLMDLRSLADTPPDGKFTPIELGKQPTTIAVTIERTPIMSDNVGGILPGKGALANEYIVIGSHYDHVGYGYFGTRAYAESTIQDGWLMTDRGLRTVEQARKEFPGARGVVHPGADDNGSGTTGNLIVAQRLAEAYAKLPDDANARSILFLWFSAEESGLVGSREYIKAPPIPKEQHYIMFNLDMIGRLTDSKLEASGGGTAEGLEEWTRPYFDASGLKINARKSGLGPSDHASFAGAGIPVTFFFTGLHTEYHTPLDQFQTINFDGLATITDLVYRITLDTAQREGTFKFTTANGRPAPTEAEGEKEGGNEPAANPGPVATGVRFGIAPGDYSGDTPGVLIGQVMENLPAAKAGLKAGDIMTKWNDTPITTVEDWMPLLSAQKPGDVVKITYLRDGKEATAEATLVARQRQNQ
jgi:hypothetical protein